jgi:hypothetical protein
MMDFLAKRGGYCGLSLSAVKNITKLPPKTCIKILKDKIKTIS